MLIDYDLFDTIQTSVIYGFAAIALLLVIAAFWKKRLVFGIGAVAAFAVAVVAIPGPDSFTTPVLLASSSQKGTQFREALLIGSRPYRFANGRTDILRRQPRPTELVINDTAQSIVISPVTYVAGPGIGGGESSTQVAPHQLLYTQLWIKYYGVGAHKPPTETKIYGYTETLYWLHTPSQQLDE